MTLPYLGPPAHFTVGDNTPPTRIVIHGTVSPCVTGGARNVAAYFRTKAAGGSAHLVADPGEVVRVAPDHMVCWHAPPNMHSLGIELCDPQAGKPQRWHDENHQAMLRLAAAQVAHWCLIYQIPIVRLHANDLVAGRRGICGHVDVTEAWHQTSHIDPGPDFLWAQFLGMVQQFATPKPQPQPVSPAPDPVPPILWPHGPRHPAWTKVLQRHLHIPASGAYDASTRRHVVAYRRHHGLHPYRPAVVGPRMWRRLLKGRAG